MNQPEHPSTPTPPSVDEPTRGYGAALLEAVRRQPRPATGFGQAGPHGEVGPARPANVRGALGQTPVTRPTPMPKRPKGRLLIATFLLLICGTGAVTVFNTLFRYQAYGAVTGRIVELAAPWGGVLETVQVREGEPVRQGQLLATVVNPELDRRVEQKIDELRIAQATLDAQVSELRLQSQLRDDNMQRSIAEYYELWGDLLQEQNQLANLVAKRQRAEGLGGRDLITPEELDERRYAEKGQRAKVDKLTEAVRELRLGLRRSDDTVDDLHAQLQPYLARLETAQNELRRLRRTASLGEIRAPVNGRVLKVRRFTGEYSDPKFPIFDILVDGSLEIVLYVSQEDAVGFHKGQVLNIEVPPDSAPARCRVERIGDRYETVPKSIEIHYRQQEKLLPVHARPVEVSSGATSLRIGSEVCLPYDTFNPLTYLRR